MRAADALKKMAACALARRAFSLTDKHTTAGRGAKLIWLRESLTSDWTSLPTRALVVVRVAVDAALGYGTGPALTG